MSCCTTRHDGGLHTARVLVRLWLWKVLSLASGGVASTRCEAVGWARLQTSSVAEPWAPSWSADGEVLGGPVRLPLARVLVPLGTTSPRSCPSQSFSSGDWAAGRFPPQSLAAVRVHSPGPHGPTWRATEVVVRGDRAAYRGPRRWRTRGCRRASPSGRSGDDHSHPEDPSGPGPGRPGGPGAPRGLFGEDQGSGATTASKVAWQSPPGFAAATDRGWLDAIRVRGHRYLPPAITVDHAATRASWPES